MAVTTAEGTLADTMGIKILSASGAEVVATMPVAGQHPAVRPAARRRLLRARRDHRLAGRGPARGPGRVVVGIEISATHHRGASDGEVTGVATLAHGGRTLATYEIVITDAAGRRVCTSRLTCLIRDRSRTVATGTRRGRGYDAAADRRGPFAPRGGRSLTW